MKETQREKKEKSYKKAKNFSLLFFRTPTDGYVRIHYIKIIQTLLDIQSLSLLLLSTTKLILSLLLFRFRVVLPQQSQTSRRFSSSFALLCFFLPNPDLQQTRAASFFFCCWRSLSRYHAKRFTLSYVYVSIYLYI